MCAPPGKCECADTPRPAEPDHTRTATSEMVGGYLVGGSVSFYYTRMKLVNDSLITSATL